MVVMIVVIDSDNEISKSVFRIKLQFQKILNVTVNDGNDVDNDHKVAKLMAGTLSTHDEIHGHNVNEGDSNGMYLH